MVLQFLIPDLLVEMLLGLVHPPGSSVILAASLPPKVSSPIDGTNSLLPPLLIFWQLAFFHEKGHFVSYVL